MAHSNSKHQRNIQQKRNLGSNATAGYDDIWSMPSYTQLYNDDSTIRPIYYRYSGNEYWTLQNGMEDLGVNIIDEHYKNYVDTKRQNMRYHVNCFLRFYLDSQPQPKSPMRMKTPRKMDYRKIKPRRPFVAQRICL